MTAYSGYVEHSDFYIAPQSYQDAFDFLCQLAVESEEGADESICFPALL